MIEGLIKVIGTGIFGVLLILFIVSFVWLDKWIDFPARKLVDYLVEKGW